MTSVLASDWSDNLLLLGRLHLDVKLGDLTQIPSARKLNMLLSGLSFQSLSETFQISLKLIAFNLIWVGVLTRLILGILDQVDRFRE